MKIDWKKFIVELLRLIVAALSGAGAASFM